jgi:hypothetical protein
MAYYALKWEKRSIFGKIDEQLPFGKELRAYRLYAMPTLQVKSGAGRLEKRKSRLMLPKSG